MCCEITLNGSILGRSTKVNLGIEPCTEDGCHLSSILAFSESRMQGLICFTFPENSQLYIYLTETMLRIGYVFQFQNTKFILFEHEKYLQARHLNKVIRKRYRVLNTPNLLD